MDIIKIHTTQQRVEDLAEFKSKFGDVISTMDGIFMDYLEDEGLEFETPCNYLWCPGDYCYDLVDRPEQFFH